MAITYGKLSDVPLDQLMTLVNHPGIVPHMPLASAMDEETCRNWAAAKDAQWGENGYGPWAAYVDGTFVGWAGFQKEGDDVDLALVLLPEQWASAPPSPAISWPAPGASSTSTPSYACCHPAARVSNRSPDSALHPMAASTGTARFFCVSGC